MEKQFKKLAVVDISKLATPADLENVAYKELKMMVAKQLQTQLDNAIFQDLKQNCKK